MDEETDAGYDQNHYGGQWVEQKGGLGDEIPGLDPNEEIVCDVAMHRIKPKEP